MDALDEDMPTLRKLEALQLYRCDSVFSAQEEIGWSGREGRREQFFLFFFSQSTFGANIYKYVISNLSSEGTTSGAILRESDQLD